MRIVEKQAERVESGAIRFGDDWPGLFLRGDEAFHLAMAIRELWRIVKDSPQKQNIMSYLALQEIASIHDMITQEVDLGKTCKVSLSDEVKDTIQRPTGGTMESIFESEKREYQRTHCGACGTHTSPQEMGWMTLRHPSGNIKQFDQLCEDCCARMQEFYETISSRPNDPRTS